jgi:hypothetical protein
VTAEELISYCTANGLEPITEGAYKDWLFQFNHDARMGALVPAVLGVLAKFQHVPECIGEEERKRLIEANEALETEICKLLEGHDILYQEIDIDTQNLGNALQSIVIGAGRRSNNMVATMFSFIAKEKYGDPLKVRALGEAYREYARYLLNPQLSRP